MMNDNLFYITDQLAEFAAPSDLSPLYSFFVQKKKLEIWSRNTKASIRMRWTIDFRTFQDNLMQDPPEMRKISDIILM